jgi:hypothetical protein
MIVEKLDAGLAAMEASRPVAIIRGRRRVMVWRVMDEP